MKKVKIAGVIVGLLALLAIANYAFRMDPTQLAARGVGRDHHHHGEEDAEENHEHEAAAHAIHPMGPEGAAVTVEVFYSGQDRYREYFEAIMERIVADYAPHLRVEPRDLTTEQGLARCRQLPLGGGQGLAVDGKVIYQFEGLGSTGMVAFTGTTADRSWHELMLRRVIEHLLDSKGVQFEPPESPQPPAPAHDHDHSGHAH